VKVGLEVHQQLSTGKLFCGCPSDLVEETSGSFVRRLRPTGGERRAVDAAAAFQAARGLRYRYETGPASCLVEMDEEPPHLINEGALDTALTLALLLEARPVDEIEVMRKIVVDGSNTSGFQRTALVAVDGQLRLGERSYSILSICLEEDAARKVRESSEEVVYRLDRLGIPLIEIATGPEITSGAEAREVAEEIGALLRSTHRVRRGIGTIREDLNVSVEGGARIEIKGVQELRKIQEYVEREAGRQGALLAARDELRRRSAGPVEAAPVDVGSSFDDLASGPLSPGARGEGPVLALRLRGFDGTLRSPPGSDERLGRELADHARTAGLRGLVHSDELPGNGIDAAHVRALRERLGLGERDAFLLVADRSEARCRAAIERVARRAAAALDGIPGETRDPLPDGRTRYSRPLPGRDRMYPETDVPPIPITEARLARLRATLPERPAALRARLARAHGLHDEVVRQLVYGDLLEPFEALTARGRSPALVARLLTQELPEVPRPDGSPPFEPSVEQLDELLRAAEAGRFGKEGLPAVLASLAAGAPTVEEAIVRAGLSSMSPEELSELVRALVDRQADLVRTRGAAAFSPLMGDLMREVRGRRDGREIAEELRRAIDRRLRGPAP
jgi:glutamyl-tRNA(Gln) amidotransferase subunit E